MSAAPKAMPLRVAETRRNVCGRCDQKCEAFLAGRVDHFDPHESCPRPWKSRWGCYGRCDDITTARPAAGPMPAAAEPTIADLATNFAGAMERWHAAGYPTVDGATYATRAAACDACSFWDGTARLGFGKCRQPGCGCTKLKRWLATEKCPLGKWPAAARVESGAAAAGGSASGGATRA